MIRNKPALAIVVEALFPADLRQGTRSRGSKNRRTSTAGIQASQLHMHQPGIRQSGFTLVEIAMALAIIGLLVGGVIKGQEMITNTRLKRIEKDNAGLVVAINSYRDRYRQTPGDDSKASERFSQYSDGINDPLPDEIDGDGDGSISGSWVGATNTETANLWKHLRASGLIPGNGDDDRHPQIVLNGNLGIRDGSLRLSGHVIIFGAIDGTIASLLETRLDDGKPSTGRIQSDLTAALMDGNAPSTAGSGYVGGTSYFMAMRI